MTNNLDAVEPTKTDIIASDACARSGAFALLLSLALVSMIPYWLQSQEDIALSRYLILRLNFATAIDMLGDSVRWQKYKALHLDVESMPLAQLLKVRSELPLSEANPNAVTSPSISFSSWLPLAGYIHAFGYDSTATRFEPYQPVFWAYVTPIVPGRATKPWVVVTVDEIQQIADFLTELGDSDLLTTSRRVSGYSNYAIYRWAFKRERLIERNIATYDAGTLRLPTQPHIFGFDNYVPPVGREDLLKHLTLRDAQELARFELPNFSVKLNDAPGGKDIEIALGALPRKLYMASVSADVLLVFVIVYFNAFAREAASSPAFPVPGTLFSAFSGSPWTLFVFLLALCSPLIGSMIVAATSRKLPLIGLSMLIGFAVFSVCAILYRKSYFRNLKFWERPGTTALQAMGPLREDEQ